MYSKEERERILADLDASGLPAAAFAKLLDNPARRSLYEWHHQAESGVPDAPAREVRGRVGHRKHAA
ncbi:hypothetical protein [Gordonibacter massiliensis (ex Traore et al. 2017)]|uniref:Transposase n=1 Tax=Gordonibacter massiliensis (ex Traore et al. 2017) TaxID=1841863 RepID=A0A842JEL5_9ACTN|nr:hypothetical protein [Gordonibacter massiliensis (ex Traore et al. 2017)]MBC2890752.1 hypothetical protein [Gordonibacter massiliensis (ex Traore et al. 2017)]